MPEQNRRLLIDAAYMFMSPQTIGSGFQFDYKKLRDRLEQDGKFFQVYYVNSTPNPPTDQQDAFHMWLKSAPPKGPRFQVRLLSARPRRTLSADVCSATSVRTLACRFLQTCGQHSPSLRPFMRHFSLPPVTYTVEAEVAFRRTAHQRQG